MLTLSIALQLLVLVVKCWQLLVLVVKCWVPMAPRGAGDERIMG
jgi:hypothetical protein